MPGLAKCLLKPEKRKRETSVGKDSLPVTVSLSFLFHISPPLTNRSDGFHYCSQRIAYFFGKNARISINHKQLKNAFELFLIKLFSEHFYFNLHVHCDGFFSWIMWCKRGAGFVGESRITNIGCLAQTKAEKLIIGDWFCGRLCVCVREVIMGMRWKNHRRAQNWRNCDDSAI